MFVYFAELDSKNIVQRIALMDSNDMIDQENDSISEVLGEKVCQRVFESKNNWRRTFRTGERNKFANIGGLYDPENDIFIDPQPHNSWVISNGEWVSPILKPILTEEQNSSGYFYIWNEEIYQSDKTQGWVLYKQLNPA